MSIIILNHVLNSFLANICFHLFGGSPLSLRLPNLIGLLVLMLATYRISGMLKQVGSKVFLTVALLLSFHWLSFFGACRGYGLSMAMLLMGLAFMLEYINDINQNRKFLACLLFFQLAISSNLILIIVVLLMSGIVLCIQLFNKKLVQPLIIISWLLHFGAIYYWLSFSFYLQDNGALYYGAGDSYWKVTFVSLIQLIIGFESPAIKYILVSLFVAVMLLAVYVNRTALFSLKDLFRKPSSSILFAIILGGLCVGFYVMHKAMGVNYPEDRTGMFFYLFFILVISFTLDELPVNFNRALFAGSAIFVIHFALNINFRKHSLNVYETIPEHFYTTLLKEQQKSNEHITIGGHRVRELFYAFFNYHHDGALNPADPTEVMQMNCDYYIATKPEEKYYKSYYDVIDTEPDWGFVLLKRKEKIIRNRVVGKKDILLKSDDSEYLRIYEKTDTLWTNSRPLLAEFNFDVVKLSKPTNTWLVFAVNDSLDQTFYFKRYPLQWSGYDLNGRKNMTYSLITGNLPPKPKKIICFLWNIDKQPVEIKLNSFNIYQIEGKGVEYEAPSLF